VLLLHGEEDRWIPVGEAQALATELQASGREVSWIAFPGLGADLGGESAEGFLAPEVERAMVDWLGALP
jgi:predicted esterase